MHTRRELVFLSLGMTVFGNAAQAGQGQNALPKASVIKGSPPILDFGEGLLVPCDKTAFLTLWEAKDFWLTFGFASEGIYDVARLHARHRAKGAMRYLLLTLAFAPDRLESVGGHGWRQKHESPNNYVLGELDVPGQFSKTFDDAYLGNGQADLSGFWGEPSGAGFGTAAPVMGSTPQADMSGSTPPSSTASVNAFCCFVTQKSQLSLKDVRERALVLKI